MLKPSMIQCQFYVGPSSIDVSSTLYQHGINVSSWLEMIRGEFYVTSFWELLLPLKRLGGELYVTSLCERLLPLKGLIGDGIYMIVFSL